MNYFRNMWPRRSHKLEYLSNTTSNQRNFKWTKIEQYDFDENKRIVACDTLLTRPDFNETFKIRTYDSNF